MYTDKVCVLGAGGHAKVVIDALDFRNELANRVIVSDENPAKIGSVVAGRVVTNWPDVTMLAGVAIHVAIGSGETRGRMQQMVTQLGACALTVIHPRAAISPTAMIKDGSFIAAQAVIGPDAKLAEGVIVNHGAVVDHDCLVGAFSHIAPNATLGGGVSVGANVLIGAGATILPGVNVGDGAVIAAGATIIRDVVPGEKVIFALTRKILES